ncbi:hypothetical protein PN498_26700 [Oscillatoria sp. CS-180]|uniref:hypothetical protein n=1 Tax=Oscillatoria sp. CS-180 TaxID=3021720 RepID=UPI00232E3701|nr:hypothetical protein [Oscillatoria sp. CS-180]MDB9529609.1 hypothetical protein [Oscillatoria sp. CS-180]
MPINNRIRPEDVRLRKFGLRLKTHQGRADWLPVDAVSHDDPTASCRFKSSVNGCDLVSQLAEVFDFLHPFHWQTSGYLLDAIAHAVKILICLLPLCRQV